MIVAATALLLGALLLGLGVGIGWALRDRTARSSADLPAQAVQSLSAALADTLQKVLILKGLPAHVAAPETFAPEGISYRERQNVRDAVESQAVDFADEASDHQAEQELQARLSAVVRAPKQKQRSG